MSAASAGRGTGYRGKLPIAPRQRAPITKRIPRARGDRTVPGRVRTNTERGERESEEGREELGGRQSLGLARRGRPRFPLSSSASPWLRDSLTLDQPPSPSHSRVRAFSTPSACSFSGFAATPSILAIASSISRVVAHRSLYKLMKLT